MVSKTAVPSPSSQTQPNIGLLPLRELRGAPVQLRSPLQPSPTSFRTFRLCTCPWHLGWGRGDPGPFYSSTRVAREGVGSNDRPSALLWLR
jgi:hypothetical protein